MKQPLIYTLLKSLLVILTSVICIETNAQYAADYKRSADKAYAQGDWFTAAQYYEKYLEQKKGSSRNVGYEPYTVQNGKANNKKNTNTKAATSDNEIIYRIAESYRKLNDYGKAEGYYAQSKNNNPLAPYYYAVCLRANNKYAEAATAFDAFLKSYTQQDEFAAQAKQENANCQFIQQQLARKDANVFSIAKAGGSLNSQGSNYAPAYNANQLVFTSSRADSSLITKKNKNPFINNVYAVEGTQAAQKLGLPFETGFEQGTATFTGDGKRVYFTRWNKVDGSLVSVIYRSDNKNGSWAEPVKLGTNVNAEGANAKQPHVTADGKFLFYSSNRVGGLGKYDLWYAPLNSDGDPGSFHNLGNSINSGGDDEAPYYSAATNSLVFATNGRTGMGGFDLFESKGTLPSNWSMAVNLGHPVNSVKDDIYFVNKSNGKLLQGAIISTDRGSACCLELYNVNRNYKKYVTGIITDCKTNAPIQAATVTATDKKTNKNVIVQSTDAVGKYFFEVKEYMPSVLMASKADYNNASTDFNAPMVIGSNDDTLVLSAVCLMPIEKVEPVDTTPVTPPTPTAAEKNALFDFAKYSLRKETVVMLDTIAALMKRESKIALDILGYTDNLGGTTFNQRLSQERADACKKYLVAKGVDANRITSTGKGECCPIEPETIDGKDNPAGRQANRRVEFKLRLLF